MKKPVKPLKEIMDAGKETDIRLIREEVSALKELFKVVFRMFRTRITTNPSNPKERILEMDIGACRRTIMLKGDEATEIPVE